MFKINFRDTKVLRGRKLFSLMDKVSKKLNMDNNNYIILGKKEVQDYKCLLHSCCFGNHVKQISCLEDLLEKSHLIYFSCGEICDLMNILNYTRKYFHYENVHYQLMELVDRNKEKLQKFLKVDYFHKLAYFRENGISSFNENKYVDVKTLSDYYIHCILFCDFNFYMTSFVAIVYPQMSKFSFKKAYVTIFGKCPDNNIVEDLEYLDEEDFNDTGIYEDLEI